MNDLFGLSMTYVMIALLVVLAIAGSTIGWVVLRNRVMFLIGVRNIPRRPAQTVLIIIGLMLSTLIISTAFSIGDTVDYSLTSTVYGQLQNVDEVVHTQTNQKNTDPDASLVTTKPIPTDQAAAFVSDIKTVPGVDGALSIIRSTVPVVDTRTRLNEPQAGLIGADPAQTQGFASDVETLDGKAAPLAALGPNEVYVDRSLAEQIDATKGDTLQLYVNGRPREFTVKDIVKDRVLSGALLEEPRGLVMSLPQAQALLNRTDVDLIVVSNAGGVRGGVDASTRIRDAVNAKLDGSGWTADATKADLVDLASTNASFLTTFFVILGLFSIAAGMLLIFLIFVMLSAERKVEMGMIRAVGTKRRHLVQMFMSEGMAYNTGAAAVGAALGVLVSIVMVRVMASLFAGHASITFYVTPRSLIVSYSLGVVLTFLTVTFSSWRVGNLNIVSAIRDLPDPPARHELPPRRGGVLGFFAFAKWVFFKPSRLREWGAAFGLLLLAPLEIGLTGALFAGAVSLYGSGAAGGVIAVLLGTLGAGAAIGAVVTLGVGLNRLFQTGAIALVVGGALVVVGFATWRAVAYMGGVSLIVIGGALTLVLVRLPQRPIYTAMGVALIGFWLLGAGGQIPPDMTGGVEMFFVSGITMVLSSTFVLVYNADLMLGLLTRVGAAWSSLVPSIRTAVAYPLANKFRTGMTIAMISLVMFALVMISTMNANFSRIFLSDDALGGYDIVVTENKNNPIGDLKTSLEQAGASTAGIGAVDEIRIANPITSEARMAPAAGEQADDFARYTVVGPSDSFIQDNGVTFHARAEALADDAAVWRELLTNPNAAVIDAFAVGGGDAFEAGGFTLSGVQATDTTFKPIAVQVRDATNPDNVRTVQIIGIFTTKASAVYSGLYVSPQTFSGLFPQPETTALLVKTAPGVNSEQEAKTIEAALSPYGVQADSLRKRIDDQQAQSQGFLYLIEGFMGIGLFVGIAAVGVVAFRMVVERRQQIGMLRALGYTRRQVAISFIMESSFIALLGVLSGIGLALLLAYQLLQGDEFAAGSVQGFYIPWLQIALIGAFAFLASLVMTIIPSRQAASIPIAQALRYE